MALESATYATQLVTTNPQSTDPRSQGDDHLRMIKTVIANEHAHDNAQWTYTGDVLTYQAASRLTTPGDRTSVYTDERRIRIDGDSVGSIYGNITSATYSANTSINVRWDSTSVANETLTTYVGDETKQGWPQGPETFVSGAWTPTLSCETPGDLSVSYSKRVGDYRRVGSMCFVHCTLRCTPTFTTASGDVYITGVPYSRWNDGEGDSVADIMPGQLSAVDWDTNYTMTLGYINSSVDALRFFQAGDSQDTISVDMTNVQSGVEQIFRITGWYMVR
jgi:hypothetical protein